MREPGIEVAANDGQLCRRGRIRDKMSALEVAYWEIPDVLVSRCREVYGRGETMCRNRATVAAVLVTAVCMALLAGPASVAAPSGIVEYPVPTAGSSPIGITAGPDGNVWFTEINADNIGRSTPAGAITEFPVPTAGAGPDKITAGPDGSLWFTESNVAQIGRCSTAGAITEFAIPSGFAAEYIVTGPDGALWFCESGGDIIGRITSAGAVTEFPLPVAGSNPRGITPGPDGALWLTENGSNKIGRITTAGAVTEFNIPTAGSFPLGITTGPDGALWFCESGVDRIGRVTTAGAFTEYNIPTAGAAPTEITTGPDGALWFTEFGPDSIGRVTTWGAIEEYATPTAGSGPWGITMGPGGRDLWFAEIGSDQVGKAVVNPGTTWYLAEGSTAWGFTTYISIENPNTVPVTARATYMTSTGPVAGGDLPLPAMSQTTLYPVALLGAVDFSTKVECLEGMTIAVDRTMNFESSIPNWGLVNATHDSVGVTAPATTWYLPEGSSAWGFECWLLIQNPNAGAATCTVTYMIENEAPQTFVKTVPANSRATFNMEDDIGQKDASIKVESDLPVIPERAMYRENRTQAQDSIGTITPALDYYLAEGTTAWGFTTYVLVQNPNPTPTDVTVTYMTSAGPQVQPAFTMPANSRETIRVNDIPAVSSIDLSTKVSGSQPIIAERAMYWNYLGNPSSGGCHDSIGMCAPHGAFYLPDGEVQQSGGNVSTETWTLVQNPNPVDVTVEISYLTPTGTGNVVFTDTVPANSRKTYDMASSGITLRAGVLVRCTTPGRKIMCERAMYWWDRDSGTDTIGGYSD